MDKLGNNSSVELQDSKTSEEIIVDVREKTANLAEKEKRELFPEDVEKTLQTLEDRFSRNTHLHEDCDWNKIKAALEADPEALWSINQMESAGHDPDIYNFDNDGFDIGTCSSEAYSIDRVYDAKAVEFLKSIRYFNFRGSAIEAAEAMGLSLMSWEDYEILQSKDDFDLEHQTWLLTDKATRESGKAFIGRHLNGTTRLIKVDAASNYNRRGWRGTRRVALV